MKKPPTFEEAMTRLEEIVSALEGGNLSLEDSLKLFEEGTNLAKFCNATLEKAEQKIITLTKNEAEASADEADTNKEDNNEGF